MVTAYLFLGLIQAAFSLFLFFLVLHQGGWYWGQQLSEADPLYHSATGITLAAIVLMQVGNVIGRRSLRGSGLDRGLLAVNIRSTHLRGKKVRDTGEKIGYNVRHGRHPSLQRYSWAASTAGMPR
jgi:hypothetical protein